MHYHDPVVAVKFLTLAPVVRRHIMRSGHLESFAYVIHIVYQYIPDVLWRESQNTKLYKNIDYGMTTW